jgi:hypothetical protein
MSAKRQSKSSILDGYRSEDQTASDLGVSLRLLRKWRQLGEGPPYVEIGRRFYYCDEKIAAWLKAHEVQPVRAA